MFVGVLDIQIGKKHPPVGAVQKHNIFKALYNMSQGFKILNPYMWYAFHFETKLLDSPMFFYSSTVMVISVLRPSPSTVLCSPSPTCRQMVCSPGVRMTSTSLEPSPK